jgi:uncharacterized protein DUF6064
MQLPFTLEQFLDVFGSYNRTMWPAAAVLWLVTVALLVRLLRGGAKTSVSFSLLLAVHWAWAGIAYHVAYFRDINPAALAFGVVFLIQAALLAWRGGFARAIKFEPDGSARARVGVGLMVYSLIYPALGLAFGLEYPRMPTFGVPCPSTILTAGALLQVRTPQVRWLAIIPLLWSIVGSSAAFLFGVRADYVLGLAGILLFVHILRPLTHATAAAS